MVKDWNTCPFCGALVTSSWHHQPSGELVQDFSCGTNYVYSPLDQVWTEVPAFGIECDWSLPLEKSDHRLYSEVVQAYLDHSAQEQEIARSQIVSIAFPGSCRAYAYLAPKGVKKATTCGLSPLTRDGRKFKC
jgi:hypothetical protein